MCYGRYFQVFCRSTQRNKPKRAWKLWFRGAKSLHFLGLQISFSLDFENWKSVWWAWLKDEKYFFSHPSGTQKGVKVIKPFYNLYIIFWTKKRNYPVKQQAHAKSLAVWLSTFFILVWPVWLQFGHCTVVGYLVRYMPFVVAPGKNPSKKRQIESKIVLTYCEKKM